MGRLSTFGKKIKKFYSWRSIDTIAEEAEVMGRAGISSVMHGQASPRGHKIFTKKISTQVLTVLIISVILQLEQRKREKRNVPPP